MEGGLHASLLAQGSRLIPPLSIQPHFGTRISILVLRRLPLPAAQTQAQTLLLAVEQGRSRSQELKFQGTHPGWPATFCSPATKLISHLCRQLPLLVAALKAPCSAQSGMLQVVSRCGLDLMLAQHVQRPMSSSAHKIPLLQGNQQRGKGVYWLATALHDTAALVLQPC